jgi:hypothetical protein
METSSTRTSAGAAGQQPAGAPSTERKGGFIPGVVAAQGCCGTTGSGSGCCGEAAASTTTTSAPAAAKPTIASFTVQSDCCGASAGSCCG